MTEEQAARMFAGMNEIIRAGEEMRHLRAEMIRLLAGAGWTQERLARLAGMSQPAVSKQVTRASAGEDAPPAADASLDQWDTPWLEGRLWGLAEELSAALDDGAHCSRLVHALARGRKRFTPQNVDALRRLMEEDLREYGAEPPFAAYRNTYDRIARGLDVLATAGRGAEAVPASRRRALACQIQRVRLHEAPTAS
ncbi:sigma-70 family RNA polymerase sigma factor [Streptomyces roseicoloratus]|uniref:sigma-70 family RNA polymerase sigma factor n=1 Tax=Streptomyces roseicoloratus TaxID=2508722 RepID=UPI001009FBD9|nr:sigma-70 family RNA polymerase sigma factor [Streptomyces roseicoloratus]